MLRKNRQLVEAAFHHRHRRLGRGRVSRDAGRRGGLESLEPRQLLAADPVISELQAINATTLQDQDGDYSDWIEIRNPDVAAQNIAGWYLTDDLADLTKWQFPANTVIDAGAHLVVFASDKDRAVSGSELHTNFRLSGDGEDLALVKPDGLTVAQVFNPYPAQFEDQSYGLAVGRDTYPLVEAGATVKATVPIDDSYGNGWTLPGFDDSSWATGTSGVGYEVLAAGFEVGELFDAPLGAEWTRQIPAGGTSTVTVAGGDLVISVPTGQDMMSDSRGTAPIVFRSVPEGAADYEVITQVTQGSADRGAAGIVIYDAANNLPAIQLEYASRLNFRLMAGGSSKGSDVNLGQDTYFLRLRRDSATKSWIGEYKINEADEWEEVGVATDGVDGTPFAADPKVGLFGRTPSSTMTARFAFADIVVPDQSPVYGPEIGLDVRAALYDQNTSLYIRIPFDFDGEPGILDELNLTTRFDDGFRAYLNGVELTAQNVPIEDPPGETWKAAAESSSGAVNGVIPVQQFSVAAALGALQQGPNVLAIQAMNVAADDLDFFFDAQLVGADIKSEVAQYFVTPTPGASNELPAAPIPQVVAGKQGLFFGSTNVELSIPDPIPTLEIRYTLDGSDPTPSSNLYTGPFTLNSSAMLQARTFDIADEPTFATSNAASATFIAVDPELQNVDSDIPLMVLDSLGRGLPGTGSTTLVGMNVVLIDVSKATGRASLDSDLIEYLGRGGARDRGSSTAGQPKPNMAFETWGATGTNQDDDEATGLLGLANDADYVLHAPYSFDKALIRNQLAFELSNQMDMWATDYRHVEVYFNRGDGVVTQADYAGTYVMLEKIEQGKDQVDIAEMSPDITRDPNITDVTAPQDISGGYIWKVDRGDPGEPGFTGGGQGLQWVYPKSPGSRTAREDQKATTEQQQWATEYLNEFRATLTNPDINDPNGYSKYIDPVRWVDSHLLNVFMMNVDALRLSAYLFKDRNERIEYGPVWDFDRAAESDDGRDDNPLVWRSEVPDFGTDFFGNGTQQWWGNLFSDPGFWQLYVDRWNYWRQTTLSDENVSNVIDMLSDDVRESAERNAAKWSASRPRASSGYRNNVLDRTYQGEVNNLRVWLAERAKFMDDNFAQPAEVRADGQLLGNANGALLPVGQEVQITPPPLEFFNDTKLVSGVPGAAVGSYFIPSDDSLGETWTARDFNASSWSTGPLGYGYDTSSNPDFTEDLIKTPVVPNDLVPGSTTMFIRIPFQVADLAEAQQDDLVLRVKYDDGYIAYINGVEVAQKNVRDQPPTWNSRASSHRDDDGLIFEDVNLEAFKNLLVQGENILAIRSINASATSNDMFIQPELVSRKVEFGINPNAVVYYTTDGTDPRGPDGQPSPTAVRLQGGGMYRLTQNTRLIARNFDDSDRGIQSQIVKTNWSAPQQYDLAVATSPLTISEINFNPQGPTEAEAAAGYTDGDFEFIEIHNPSFRFVDLLGVQLTDGVEFDFAQSSVAAIAPGGYLVVVRNPAAFEMRYGAARPVAGTFTGNLDNNGEDIDLRDATGAVIFSVNYGDNDPWPSLPDGQGATLELVSPGTVTPATASKWYSWRASTERGGTPGAAGVGSQGIVINEILARSDANAQLKDSIELRNTSGATIDVGGWFLSDSTGNLFKFQIPAGTTLAAGAYVVFNADQFNAPNDPEGFGLSGTNGDSVYLVRGSKSDTAPQGGLVSHYIDEAHFRPTLDGESVGRIPDGSGRLAPLKNRTLGTANVDPRVGPIVITEIQYNPVPSEAALAADPTLEASDLEFIEVYNPTSTALDLTEWRLRGGADYDFPAGSSLAAGETIVVLKFNPDDPENINQVNAFRAHYAIDASVRLIGGYQGLLGNGGEQVVLLRPDAGPDPGTIVRVQEDEVLYDDLAPWPTIADGTGRSLQRVSPTAFGNAATSWIAASGTPGTPTLDSIPGDLNGDGVANAADINALFVQMRSATPDLSFDLTGDGLVNEADRDELVLNLIGTTYGDANVDGIFNSSDFVHVFQIGEYEDAIDGNSTWEDGDWDGDADFTTADMVLAFQTGGYSAFASPELSLQVQPESSLGNRTLLAAALDEPEERPLFAASRTATPSTGDSEAVKRPLLELVDSSFESLFEGDESAQVSESDAAEGLAVALADDGFLS